MSTPAKVYRDIASIPQYSQLINVVKEDNTLCLTVLSTRNDFTKEAKARAINYVDFDSNSKSTKLRFPVELDDGVGLIAVSPSNKLQARLCTSGDKRYVEIIGNSTVRTIEVTKSHGPFYNDDYFGRLSWSKDESQLIYVAEVPAKEDAEVFLFNIRNLSSSLMPVKVIQAN